MRWRRRAVMRARCGGGACMQRGGVGRPRDIAVQAARRYSRLHRWGMQRLHTRRRAAILQPFSAARSIDHAVVLHTRARRSRIARRGVARCDLVCQSARSKTHSHFDLPRPRRRYGDAICHSESSQTYLRQTSAPAEHALSQRHRRSASEFAAEQTQRPHGNARLRHAVGANEAGRAAPVTPS